MVDPADAIGMAREAVAKRVELPGMSLMEHLDELRKRIVRSAIFLALGFVSAWAFHDRFVGFIQAPLNHIGKTLVFTHPMDPLNLTCRFRWSPERFWPRPSSSTRCGCSLRQDSIRKRSAS